MKSSLSCAILGILILSVRLKTIRWFLRVNPMLESKDE